MLQQNHYQQYKQTSVETASPERLILMLYDGEIKFLNQAKAFLQEGNIQETNKAIKKAQDIINELIVSLKLDTGEIAQNLYSLYDYFRRKLIEANTKKDTVLIDEVLGFFGELREAWAEAVIKSKASPVMNESINNERINIEG